MMCHDNPPEQHTRESGMKICSENTNVSLLLLVRLSIYGAITRIFLSQRAIREKLDMLNDSLLYFHFKLILESIVKLCIMVAHGGKCRNILSETTFGNV